MIRIENLNFSYKKGVKVLNNLSFQVPKGSIYGFLGANGSGKTTTIRILLGLCNADSGQIFIDGKEFSKTNYLRYKNIGAMIEAPSLYGHLSGMKNLQFVANYYNVKQDRIDEVLKIVDLEDTKNKKVKNYSLGMKQRIGIAQSILHNPDILVLDEPLNGLDPKGIKEIRELLFKLRDEGKTIFISSHLLSEVEKSCDYFCIIDKGTHIFSEKVSHMQQMLSKNIDYKIECSNAEKVKSLLLKDGLKAEIKDNSQLTVSLPDDKIIASYIQKINTEGIDLFEVRKKDNSLEDIFLKLTMMSHDIG